jgi:hypothetical protein
VTLRRMVAALLDESTVSHPVAASGSAGASAVPVGWSPEDELEGGEEFYADLIERSQPFSVRLEHEQGWPSEA